MPGPNPLIPTFGVSRPLLVGPDVVIAVVAEALQVETAQAQDLAVASAHGYPFPLQPVGDHTWAAAPGSATIDAGDARCRLRLHSPAGGPGVVRRVEFAQRYLCEHVREHL